MKRALEAEDLGAHIFLDQTCLVRDLLLPILVERGNFRDLVSFCATNSRFLRMFRNIEENCHLSMMAYRLVPLRHACRVIPRRLKQIGREFTHFGHVAVVALCDTAFSIKKDTILYIRVSNELSAPKYAFDFRRLFEYWYQARDNGIFECGVHNNLLIRELLETASPVDYFILH